jgi:hypothetical protein
MTNKMPVVGKRYKGIKPNSFVSPTVSRIVTEKLIAVEEEVTVVSFLNINNMTDIRDFWNYYEELPTFNSQETEEVQEVAPKYCPLGMSWDFVIDRKINFKITVTKSNGDGVVSGVFHCSEEAASKLLKLPLLANLYTKSYLRADKVNETPNPVDLEKGEVNEVERALERFKLAINSAEARAMTGETGIVEKVLNRAQDLINALESKPKPEIFVDESKVGGDFTAKAKVSKDELDTKKFDSCGVGTKLDMFKPKSKIDMKEEHVEPVSIWKDVSELPHFPLEYEELEKSRSSLYDQISSIFEDYLVTLYLEKLDNIQKLKGK